MSKLKNFFRSLFGGNTEPESKKTGSSGIPRYENPLPPPPIKKKHDWKLKEKNFHAGTCTYKCTDCGIEQSVKPQSMFSEDEGLSLLAMTEIGMLCDPDVSANFS